MNKKLLVIGLVWPEPNSTAAGQRMMQLLNVFLEDGYHITFSSTAQETEYSEDLEVLGIRKKSIQLNSSNFDEFLQDLKPNVVLFDRYITEEQFGWRVAEHAPNTLRILDTEDLHSLRHVREKLFKKDIPFTFDAWLHDEKTLRELASIYRSDLSLIISSYEMQVLKEKANIDASLLLHLPFMVDPLPDRPDWAPYDQQNDFIFIGGGKHAPNIDAIQCLKTEIWPLIRKQLPKAQLNIYGSYLPQHISELHRPEDGFCIRGRAKNVSEVMSSAKVCLAPLRFGAGIKGKLLQAMQQGTPSVTTTTGAEGMHGDLPWNGHITNDPTDFAKAAVQLYTDQKAWETAQKAGIVLVNTLYKKKNLKKSLLESICSLQTNLEEHRCQNLIGRMLQHQTLNSTKYMAKWIEEKNKGE